jgi:hypothetical protein
VRLGYGSLIEVETRWTLSDCLNASLLDNAFQAAEIE